MASMTSPTTSGGSASALITTPRAWGFPIDLPDLATAPATENDVSAVVERLENPRDAGANLGGGLSRVASDGFTRCVGLVHRQVHLRFRHLIPHDEQYLVMPARERLRCAKNVVEMRTVVKGYVSFKGNRDAFRSRVTGEWLLM